MTVVELGLPLMFLPWVTPLKGVRETVAFLLSYVHAEAQTVVANPERCRVCMCMERVVNATIEWGCEDD